MSGDIVVNDSYEILTPNGWQNFLGVKRSFKQIINVKFSDEHTFTCTPNHIIVQANVKLKAASLKPNQLLYGRRVVSISLGLIIDVYDPIEVAGGNTYLSDNIVSHNCNFLGSSATLINANTISQLSPGAPIYTRDGLDIYESPIKAIGEEKEHVYFIAADTAKGVGGDYSAFVIIDITTLPYKMVGKYRDNNISPMLYPSVLYKVATEYNEAYVLIEINSSEQVADILYSEYEYGNILMINRSGDGQIMSGGFGGGKTQLGVITDKRVKRIGCSNFKTLVEEQRLLIPDADVIGEISTFIQVKNSYAADDGYHDDLVMPLVLFAWASTNPYFKELSDINIRQVIYENQMKAIEQQMTPFGFYDDGREEVLLNF